MRATCWTSLSPRPERFTTIILSFGYSGARFTVSARACADSSAGMMPSFSLRRVKAPSASVSGAYRILYPPSVV